MCVRYVSVCVCGVVCVYVVCESLCMWCDIYLCVFMCVWCAFACMDVSMHMSGVHGITSNPGVPGTLCHHLKVTTEGWSGPHPTLQHTVTSVRLSDPEGHCQAGPQLDLHLPRWLA